MRRRIPIHKIFSLIRVLLAIISTGILIGCTPNQQSSFQFPEQEKIANKIHLDSAKKLRDEMSLIPLGFGGQIKDQVFWLKLAFQYRQSLDIEEGRRLLIHATEIFLNEINSNKKIRPYLSNYPFQPKNVTIWIFLQNPDGTQIEEGHVKVLSSSEGVLEYDFQGPDKNKYLKTVREKYQDGKHILELENEKTDSYPVEPL